MEKNFEIVKNCSSLTVQNEKICKVNGKLILTKCLALSHSKHVAFKDDEIIGMNFVKKKRYRL
jgi:hypothetical protein